MEHIVSARKERKENDDSVSQIDWHYKRLSIKQVPTIPIINETINAIKFTNVKL